MCSKERECTRKRANSDGCYLFEYETGIVFLSSRSQPSTHLKRREHQQPHVQLEDFKKVGHFPCPEPECEQVLPSKQGLSNHRRTAHKSDSSDQPLSSTGRRRQPRRQKSARKDATDMQCCSKNLPPRHKNTERTASSSGRRRRVGSTAADRSAQAAAAACAAGEEALDWVDNNQEERQDMAVVTKRMANLALRRANEEQELRPNYEHETESSDVDEDEYVVESDDDLPAVEHRSSVDMRRESLAEILDLGTSGTLARIGASLFPGKREERWVDPLPEKLQFQQQKNKIAELKCKYSRANAKVRWYKGRKELFSDGSKYEILIDKQSITLIINNLDPDDSGKYKCEANGMPTNAFVTVEGPSIKYVFLTPLPNTMDIYRTKQGVLACKLDSPRAPLVWQRDGKPIDVDDPRYQIENDAAGCFTLTIRVVERIDQGMWTATVNKDVNSKCQVYVVEDPRDTFVVPEQLRNETAANEEKAPDDRDKVPGEPPVTADGKTKYGAENESREKPRLAKRTKQSAPAGRSLRVRGQTSGEPVVLNFLTWQPPAEDGGSKLEGYLVQKREWGHEQWEKATPDMCPLTECLVPGLREFQAYVFRVIAVNLHGRSTPSLHTLPINIVETAGACPTIVINKELSVQGPSVVPLKSQRANEKEKDATQIRTPKTAQPSSAHGIGPSLDQPLSSTARRCQPRRSARKDATDIQCENLTPPRPKNTERTTSGSGRRRVGSTAAARQAQAAAAACAAGEEAPNEQGRQDVAVVTKKMAILALRRANDEHETESSAVDEDEYVVESDDDIPAVEHRSSVDMRRESLAEILDLGTSGTLARIGAID